MSYINIRAQQLNNATPIDALVIGSGIYGLHLAEKLKNKNIKHRVVAKNYYLDYEDEFYSKTNENIKMASIANYAKLDLGYDYANTITENEIKHNIKNYKKFKKEFKNELLDTQEINNIYCYAEKDNNKYALNNSNWYSTNMLISQNLKVSDGKDYDLNGLELKNVKGVQNVVTPIVDTFKMMERKTYNYLKNSEKTNPEGIILSEIEAVVRKDNHWYVSLKNNSEIYKVKYIFNCTYTNLKQIEKIFKTSTDLNINKYEIREIPMLTGGIADKNNLKKNALTIFERENMLSIRPLNLSLNTKSQKPSAWVLEDNKHLIHKSSDNFNIIMRYFNESIFQSNRKTAFAEFEKYIPPLDIEKSNKFKKSMYTIKINDDKDKKLNIYNDNTNTFFSILGKKLLNIYDLDNFINKLF